MLTEWWRALQKGRLVKSLASTDGGPHFRSLVAQKRTDVFELALGYGLDRPSTNELPMSSSQEMSACYRAQARQWGLLGLQLVDRRRALECAVRMVATDPEGEVVNSAASIIAETENIQFLSLLESNQRVAREHIDTILGIKFYEYRYYWDKSLAERLRFAEYVVKRLNQPGGSVDMGKAGTLVAETLVISKLAEDLVGGDVEWRQLLSGSRVRSTRKLLSWRGLSATEWSHYEGPYERFVWRNEDGQYLIHSESRK